VVHRDVAQIGLPKARKPLPDFLVGQNSDSKGRLALDIGLKRDFGAGEQANRHMRFADRRETARDRVVELRHDQSVLDFCGS
jgi:hypothetical protein